MSCKRNIEVCLGPHCGGYGGHALADSLRRDGHQVSELACQSLCPHGPIARRDGEVVHKATLDAVLSDQ